MKKKSPSTPHPLPVPLGVPFLFIQFRTLAFLFFSNFLPPLNIQVYFPDFISSPLAVHRSVLRPTGNIHLTPAPDVFVIKQLQTTGVPAALFFFFFRRPSWLGRGGTHSARLFVHVWRRPPPACPPARSHAQMWERENAPTRTPMQDNKPRQGLCSRWGLTLNARGDSRTRLNQPRKIHRKTESFSQLAFRNAAKVIRAHYPPAEILAMRRLICIKSQLSREVSP